MPTNPTPDAIRLRIEGLRTLASIDQMNGAVERARRRRDEADRLEAELRKMERPQVTWAASGNARQEANARLIAAAPDMLVALKFLVATFLNPGDDGEFEHGEVPALDVARAAIAKAESAR